MISELIVYKNSYIDIFLQFIWVKHFKEKQLQISKIRKNLRKSTRKHIQNEENFVIFNFLVADTELYKRSCLSVGPWVRRSVGPSVRRSVGHAPVVTLESKTRKNAAVGIVYVWVCWREAGTGVGEWGWGEAGGWMPLPTRPQRYCDPASLV